MYDIMIATYLRIFFSIIVRIVGSGVDICFFNGQHSDVDI